MVSFKTLIPLATLLVLVQGQGHHVHHKRYRAQPRHYGNYTVSAGESSTSTTLTPPLGTGYESTSLLPDVTSTSVPYVSPPASVVEECSTHYETKVVTYTLGNGNTHTTTVVYTKVETVTLTPYPVPTTKDPVPEVPETTPGAGANEVPDHGDHEEYETTSTTTSTTTVVVTLTRTIPRETTTPPLVAFTEMHSAPCPVATVTVTVPSRDVVYKTVTVKEIVKETVKETVTVGETTVKPIVETPVESKPPVVTTAPVLPPYSNHTTTSIHQVTLTVVPIPYE